MDMKLEVFVLPVANADQAKAFYHKLGWREDADIVQDKTYRVIQFTPPGSACSIIFGTGLTQAVPGSYQDLTLIVDDIEAARAELINKGVEVSEIFHGGIFGNRGRLPGIDPERKSYASLVSFSDPDGNGWLVQEIRKRLPGR